MRLELSASNRGAALDHDGPGLPELVTPLRFQRVATRASTALLKMAVDDKT